jgi:hypothetical protein
MDDLRHLCRELSTSWQIADDPVGAGKRGEVSAAPVDVVPGTKAKFPFDSWGPTEEGANPEDNGLRVVSLIEPGGDALPHSGGS